MEKRLLISSLEEEEITIIDPDKGFKYILDYNFHQSSFLQRLRQSFPDLCRNFPRTGDEGRTVAARAVAPGLEMLAIAIFTAQSDHLACLPDSTGWAALDTGRAAAIKSVKAIAVDFRVRSYGRSQPKGGDDAADPAVDPPIGN